MCFVFVCSKCTSFEHDMSWSYLFICCTHHVGLPNQFASSWCGGRHSYLCFLWDQCFTGKYDDMKPQMQHHNTLSVLQFRYKSVIILLVCKSDTWWETGGRNYDKESIWDERLIQFCRMLHGRFNIASLVIIKVVKCITMAYNYC